MSRKVIEMHPEPTGTKRSRFGWCQFGPDLAHQTCRAEFTDRNGQHHACSCECHGDPGAAA